MYKVCAVAFNERSGHAGLTFSLALILYMSQDFIHKYTKIPEGSLLTDLAKIGRDTPLIAVMVMYLFNEGVDLTSLTKDELVELAFESYLNDIFMAKFGVEVAFQFKKSQIYTICELSKDILLRHYYPLLSKNPF